MKIIPKDVAHYTISDIKDLDPIDVFMQDFEFGKGQVTIACFGSAWSNYWGSTGELYIKNFIQKADVDYLVSKFLDYQNNPSIKYIKARQKYLTRVVTAIKEAFGPYNLEMTLQEATTRYPNLLRLGKDGSSL